MTQPSIVQEIRVSGFDPKGDPHIRVLRDGTVRIVFEFMPPSLPRAMNKPLQIFTGSSRKRSACRLNGRTESSS